MERYDESVNYITYPGCQLAVWVLLVHLRIKRKPGETMEVDWVGDTLKVYDVASCSDIPAYILVAVLPCSLYGYAEACPDMKSNHWIEAHMTNTAARWTRSAIIPMSRSLICLPDTCLYPGTGTGRSAGAF